MREFVVRTPVTPHPHRCDERDTLLTAVDGEPLTELHTVGMTRTYRYPRQPGAYTIDVVILRVK